MKYMKAHWKFLLFILIFGIIGGISTGIYSINSIDPKLVEEAIKQIGSKEVLIIITAIQTVIYAVVFGVLGIIISNKIGLWKKIEFEKNKTLKTIGISIIGGLFMILGDLFLFGNFNDLIKSSYDVKPTIDYIIASFTYGGVIEEVMLRLFFLSFIALILSKLFYKKEKTPPVIVFVVANIISAFLFATLHLPSTIQLFGGLDYILFIRCMIMNGMFGLIFGYLYRKYGIHYAMLAHFGCHFISKLIWLLFI